MNEETLFELALRTPEADRGALLDRACADIPGLRTRVEALLRADAIPLLPLQEATSAPLPEQPPATEDYGDLTARIGSVIAGKYKLIEQIGEGGMGQVYMAQQTEPVKRAVAVKVIKAGMDTKAVLIRFEAERQALAMMDHPNIAKVLDAGTTEGGRPYFVMELVKGQPITSFCDERKLTPRQRLELFIPVCQAIQHAHQKGVVHRDIKPNNVLVAMYDDQPVPKVIDFGVAKAAGQTLTDKTLMTGFGAVVGTPEYMSPEQANMNNLDIDTRSDVYSLGVLLYELLTGTTPVDRKSLGQAALLEVLRIVRDVEAPKPSHRLSTAEGLPSVAANRNTEPAKLSHLMKGELDWVVLKALEKDRTRRYDTANALSRDIQRYLADEMVEARPPSTAYRLKKMARKNRAVLTTAAVITVLLLGGAAISAGLAVRATHAEKAARTAEEQIKRERDMAQRSFEDAKAAEGLLALGIRFALLDWQRSGVAKGPMTAELFLGSIVKTLDDTDHNLEDNPGAEAGTRKLVGWLLEELELNEAAGREYDKQLVLLSRIDPTGESEATAAAKSSLGRCLKLQGRLHEAEPHLRQALVTYQRIKGPEHVYSLYSMRDLADVLVDLGMALEAESLLKRALSMKKTIVENEFLMLDITDILARAYEGQRLFEQAEVLLRKNLQSRRRIHVPDWHETIETQTRLGTNLIQQAKYSEAEPLLRESLAIREKTQPDVWTTFNTKSLLGGALLGQKKYTDAELLLVRGYEGMTQHEKSITGTGKLCLPEALDRLILLYTETNKPEEVKRRQGEKIRITATPVKK